MKKKLEIWLALLLLVFAASPSPAVTTQKENDLLIRQAWKAGQQMIENGLYKRGAAYLEAYVKNRPMSADGWYWLAKGYQGQGMLKKAQDAFTKVLEVDPEYPPLSRVFQNRATGDAIPLMDPAGSDYMQGLPIVDPEKGIFADYVTARPAPIEAVPKAPVSPGGQIPSSPLTDGQSQSPRTYPGFSPMGARKTVIAPPPQGAPEPAAEPEMTAMPMIMIPDEMWLITVPVSKDAFPGQGEAPKYIPPAPLPADKE